MTERDLLISLKAKKEQLEAAKEAAKTAQKEYDEAEHKVLEHLENIGAESTASYEGLGYAKMSKPRVFASCLKENESKLKEKLREMGRDDIIKETVHSQSLSSLVGEMIEKGDAIPPMINYYLETKVRIY